MTRIYLDYAASTPVDPRALKAMLPFFSEKFGNPSSIHSFGQETRSAIETAREKVAKLIGALPEEIIFTSGGTEADNHALVGIAYANGKNGNHIITSAIEHHAITECCEFLKKRGFEITYLPVDQYGRISPESITRAITEKTILASIMHANNEVGTIETIGEIAERIRKFGPRKIYFHTDAVQTVGHIPVDVKELGVDLLSISAHKLYGPKGVGALYVKKGTPINSFIHGGGQEQKRRASTENVPGIVGFGIAADIALEEMTKENVRIAALQQKLIKGIIEKIPDTRINGHPTERLSSNVNISVSYVEGESLLLNLDLAGIAASSGSACASGSLDPSHVLLAMGIAPEDAHGSLRFSLGRLTTEKEIEYVLEKFPAIVEKLREMSPLYHHTKN